MNWIRHKASDLFGVDLRSLALFRIGLGLMVLIDAARRSLDAGAFYTDLGVLPRAALVTEAWESPWYWSLFLANGQTWFTQMLLLLTGLAALAMILGYRTRFATIVCWVLIVSVQNRNPLVVSGADELYRMLLFWSMFLPLGARWSFDQLHRPPTLTPETPRLTCSIATAALLLQVVFMYVFSALLKDHPIWHTDGTALYFAFSHQFFATDLATWLRQYPELLKTLTIASYYFELFGPALAFLPFFTGPARTLTVFAFIGFHFGIWMTLYVEQFAGICMVAWLPFLPSWFWEKFCPWLGRVPLVSFGIQFLESTGENLAALARSADKGLRTVDDYRCIPLEERIAPGAERLVKTTVEFFVALCLIYVFLWNIRSVEFSHNKVHPQNKSEFWQTYFPTSHNWFGQLLKIEQYWNMFSPFPDLTSGYFVVQGKSFLGDTIFPFERVATNWREAPERPALAFPNQRWRKFMDRMTEGNNQDLRLHFGRYISRNYNDNRRLEDAMRTFSIDYIEQHAVLPGRPLPDPVTFTLWEHRCFNPAQEAKIKRSLKKSFRLQTEGASQTPLPETSNPFPQVDNAND